ncbi:hypothetical protein GGR52DRAFT_496605 [Hypoxylon sp. FL1284]|nr:hypothetical protein GGR52DRAFT_496605 [Hypoxylon sp. FL1284]
MPVEIVTVVNSSGKIISNGRHLFSVFKEAKASYQEKKAAIKAERAVRRSETFAGPTVPRYDDDIDYGKFRRASIDDAVSRTTSRRSSRSKRGDGPKRRSASQARTALTERNLKTLTEVSSTAPSRPPVAYRSPYAETAPRDMALSRPTLVHAPTVPIYDDSQFQNRENSVHVPRSHSDPALGEKGKEIDMNLAYGNVPPDLEERVDLDPAYKAAQKEQRARTLMEKIESLLTEAHCLHHTATHIIQHLQGNPDAAAAVALTLAELSALLGKMSPSFLAVIKGGSPAIFALLASPQFLIAAGVTVGVTVVMFGGWKIVKRIQEVKEAQANAAAPMVFAARQPPPVEAPPTEYSESEVSAGFDEALVLEEELSSIESWRRGIVPFGEDDQADQELISPEADRAIRSQYGGDDSKTVRSSRTTRTHRSTKTSKTQKSHKSRKEGSMEGRGPSENKSSADAKDAEIASEAGSHRSHRSHQSHRSDRTERTERTTKTKRSIKTIEDGSGDKENTINAVLRPKKDNMLKTLFKKKKDREDKERSYSVVR